MISFKSFFYFFVGEYFSIFQSQLSKHKLFQSIFPITVIYNALNGTENSFLIGFMFAQFNFCAFRSGFSGFSTVWTIQIDKSKLHETRKFEFKSQQLILNEIKFKKRQTRGEGKSWIILHSVSAKYEQKKHTKQSLEWLHQKILFLEQKTAHQDRR